MRVVHGQLSESLSEPSNVRIHDRRDLLTYEKVLHCTYRDLSMHFTRDGRLVRTDIWREGKWLDLWSIVHALTGASLGFAFSLFSRGEISSVIIMLLLLTAYEMWEYIVHIEETFTNRVMDVVVGMASFLPIYLSIAPRLTLTAYILAFGFTLTTTIVMSVFGWIASQKAATLEAQLRERYKRRKAHLLQQKLDR